MTTHQEEKKKEKQLNNKIKKSLNIGNYNR